MVWHRDINSGSVSQSWTYPCGTQTYDAPYNENFRILVFEQSIKHYDRSLWYRPLPNVVYSPYINWKRTLDGMALSYQPIRDILRSLR